MVEYWVEENIRPVANGDFDRALFEHIRDLVNHMKGQNWIIHWHFLREGGSWRGNQQILHIRFRVRVLEANLQLARNYITSELDAIQTNVGIADHYRGNHGMPDQEYVGEAANFDETNVSPEGWEVTQKWLEAGSEIELVLLKNRFEGIPLGRRFVLSDLLHFPANQFDRNHVVLQPANQMVIQL